MNPRRLHFVAGNAVAGALSSADRLPLHDAHVLVAGDGSLLLPPLMWEALEHEYGAAHLTELLHAAGLEDAGPARFSEALRAGLHDAGKAAHAVSGLVAEGIESIAGLLPDGDEPDPQWHLAQCRVQDAWEVLGLDPQAPQIDWKGLRIGHVDTGYTEHPVFGFPTTPWIDVAAARSFDGGTVSEGAIDPMQGAAAGHGTGSGSLCSGWSPAHPYVGVAPRLTLVPVRVADCYILDKRAQEFEAAVRYLVDEVDVPVINVSMGTFLKRQAPDAVARAVDYCYEKGVIMVAAAGNVPWPGWPAFPAASARTIAVAGVTREDRPWAISSSGDWVDFSASARQVPRAKPRRADSGGLDYGYVADAGGTTFATAMTSGAAALWLHHHGAELRRRYTQPWQRVEAFRAAATSTARRPAVWDAARGFGRGILDVAALMNPANLPDADLLVPR